MYQFATRWTDEIAAVSEQFQDATVSLLDPSLVTSVYDVATGQWTHAGDPLLGSFSARIIGARWGVNRENNDTGNSMTQSAVRVQIPKKAVGFMKRGIQLRVTLCEDNPSLTSRVYSLTSDLQGSNVASRTFEFSVDGDAVAL